MREEGWEEKDSSLEDEKSERICFAEDSDSMRENASSRRRCFVGSLICGMVTPVIGAG